MPRYAHHLQRVCVGGSKLKVSRQRTVNIVDLNALTTHTSAKASMMTQSKSEVHKVTWYVPLTTAVKCVSFAATELVKHKRNLHGCVNTLLLYRFSYGRYYGATNPDFRVYRSPRT